MDTNDIYGSNYKEAISYAQKTLYAGLVISIFSYFFINGLIPGNNLQIPFLEIDLSSKNISIYGLAALYFYSGVQCLFFTHIAEKNILSITDKEISKALFLYPCIIRANVYYQTFLAIILLGVWYIIFIKAGVVGSEWLSYVIGGIVSAPYYISLKIGSRLSENE